MHSDFWHRFEREWKNPKSFTLISGDWGGWQIIVISGVKVSPKSLRSWMLFLPTWGYVTGTKKFSPSIMLWGAIRADGCKVLLKCEGSVDQNEYQRLLHNGLPQIYSTKYILMHDGAPCRRARSKTEYLRQKAVRILKDWPAQSTDLNIIENLWQD